MGKTSKLDIKKLDIKDYLAQEVEKSRMGLHIKLGQVQEAQKVLDRLALSNATYLVSLHSLWADKGGKSTVTFHKGSLEGAIKAAETEFAELNHRQDDQKDWRVQIVLGVRLYDIPSKYWEKFKMYKNPQDR